MSESRTLCVCGHRFFHRFHVQELSFPFDLLAWLDRQEDFPKCYWQSRDKGFEAAVCGSVMTLDQVPVFESGNDSDARFWGGHAFFPSLLAKDALWHSFPRRAFFLPKIEIIRLGKKIQVITHSLNAPLDNEIDLSPAYFAKRSGGVQEKENFPSSETWMNSIETALKQIDSTTFEKIVLARRTTRTAKAPLYPLELLSRLRAEGAFLFALQFSNQQGFIGATPERLYKRTGKEVMCEALAGTSTEAQELLKSAKLRSEFQPVKTSIIEDLKPLCATFCCEEEDRVIKASNVFHLHNVFRGTLHSHIHDETILAALHPTAALGGFPRKSALEHLLSHEPFERGWYGSPIGFVSEKEADFAIAIRSALVDSHTLHLFAGAGIVTGSDAKKEWEELEVKTAIWEKVLQ